MTILTLFLVFAKIGLFSFGGGYAMIPLIQREISRRGWMTDAEFIDIVAIAEMTPGPIAVNAATFVGFKTAGLLGGVIATIGVALPSCVLILLVADAVIRHKNHPLRVSVFSVLRPIVAALVLTAAYVVGTTALSDPRRLINPRGAAIAGLSVLGLTKTKLHPIVLIILAGVLGALLGG